MKKGNRVNCLFSQRALEKLFSDVQLFNDRPVPFDILFFQVLEQASAFSDEADQGTFGDEVFLVGLEMFCQVLDLHGEEGYLGFGRTGVKL